MSKNVQPNLVKWMQLMNDTLDKFEIAVNQDDKEEMEKAKDCLDFLKDWGGAVGAKLKQNQPVNPVKRKRIENMDAVFKGEDELP